LNRAKESHQSTNRAPLSNSPAVSSFKTALSSTSCASAADILCYADCTLCSLDKLNTPYLTSFPQRYCCLQIAICLPRATSVCQLRRLVGPRFSTSRISAKPGFYCSAVCISLLRLTRISAVCILSHRVPILRHADNIPVAAHLNSMLGVLPRKAIVLTCLQFSSKASLGAYEASHRN
jgi:hypothetical protein